MWVDSKVTETCVILDSSEIKAQLSVSAELCRVYIAA